MINSNYGSRAFPHFIVAKTGVTLKTSGTLNGAGGVINLTDGQFGMVNNGHFGAVAMNSFLGATPTIDDAPVVKLYQGTAYSANPATTDVTYPLWARPYEETQRIDGRRITEVTKQAYRAQSHNAWVIGDTAAGAGAINVLDNEEYQIALTFSSVRNQIFFSASENMIVRASITTPNFTALATAQPIDWITTKLAYQLNQNAGGFTLTSRKGNAPFVALQLASSGGTAIAGLTAGSFLPVVTTDSGVKGIVLTAEMIASIQAAVVAATAGTTTAFTHILTIDLATAGTATGGTGLGIMLLALNEGSVYKDRIVASNVRLTANLTLGFNQDTVNVTEAVKADPGQGQGKMLDRWYKNTQGQTKYSNLHSEDPYIEFPSPFDVNGKYVTYCIMHNTHPTYSHGSELKVPNMEVICIPSTETTLITAFEAQLNSYLQSADNTPIIAEDN